MRNGLQRFLKAGPSGQRNSFLLKSTNVYPMFLCVSAFSLNIWSQPPLCLLPSSLRGWWTPLTSLNRSCATPGILWIHRFTCVPIPSLLNWPTLPASRIRKTLEVCVFSAIITLTRKYLDLLLHEAIFTSLRRPLLELIGPILDISRACLGPALASAGPVWLVSLPGLCLSLLRCSLA